MRGWGTAWTSLTVVLLAVGGSGRGLAVMFISGRGLSRSEGVVDERGEGLALLALGTGFLQKDIVGGV